jgi:Zn-dependent peptidase ImmA (M78 family)/transcriptional regulator with XRE-family HTH domain
VDGQEFVGERLHVARDLAGLTQTALARRVGISPAAVSQFEGGAARPSSATLALLADELGVPQPFLMRALVDTHEGFFRSLRRTAVSARRRARAVAHIAHDVALHAAAAGSLGAATVPRFGVPLDGTIDDVERAAGLVRQAWGISSGPVDDVVGLLEAHGVVVIRLPLSTAAVDAFSLPFADHPVVVLGADKNDRARSRFDGAHELGHLVLHGEQIWGLKQVEIQAHQFAAAFLMPESEIREHLPSTVDWPRLFELKKYWQVSLAALLRRARELGRMTPGTYLTAVKAASARGWRRVEPVPLGHPEQPQFVARYLASPQGERTVEFLPASVLKDLVVASS